MMRESDTLILTDIYYGGGTVKRSFSGEDFATAVSQQHKKTIFVANLANLPKVLSDAITGKSAICLAGARTIHDWTMAVQSELFSTN
jgi:UDP-N-acetylmuramate-alanine ligase